jgi:hypothetical protein
MRDIRGGPGNLQDFLISDLGRWGPFRKEGQLQVVDDTVHNRIVGEETNDLHLTALMEPLTLLHEYYKAAALRAEHRIDLVNLADHGSASQSSMRLPNQGRPALGGDGPQLLLCDPEGESLPASLPDLPPVGVGIEAVIAHRELAFVGNMGGHPGDEV